jgi:hypothetical protein
MYVRSGLVLSMLVASVAPAGAVDHSGEWTVGADCRDGGTCDPLGPPTFVDDWTITQVGSDLTIDSSVFVPTFTGTIDSASGAFVTPQPPNFIEFAGVGTFSTIRGTYDSLLQSGAITGGRRCDPFAPACDDGTGCTDDACVETTLGTCTDMTPVAVCVNTPNGSCATTTTTSTSTTTTSLPPTHHPISGERLVLKRSSSGRQILVFVSKDPTVYVPAFGAADDPTVVGSQIDVYSPAGSSPPFAITIPPVSGTPGWTTAPSPPAYRFRNASAPAGYSVVRQVKLRAGKGLKIVARATGLDMTRPLGAVGIAWRLADESAGTPVICARFGSASVRRDVPPAFVARAAPPPASCFPATLGGP